MCSPHFPPPELPVKSILRWTRCCQRGSPADRSRRRWRSCRRDSSSCSSRRRKTERAENRACTAESCSTAEPQSSASRSCGPNATGRNTLTISRRETPEGLRIPAQTKGDRWAVFAVLDVRNSLMTPKNAVGCSQQIFVVVVFVYNCSCVFVHTLFFLYIHTFCNATVFFNIVIACRCGN